MCSERFGLMFAPIGSKMKSIPSRLANFAAGTKSLSPEISIIWSTCFLYAREAISMPNFMSTPFCSRVIEKSFSVTSLNVSVPANNFLVVS